jgi:hypothetical protein
VLRAEAIKLVLARPGVWTLRALSGHLAHRYRLSPALVRDLLEQAPELRQAKPSSKRPVPLSARSAPLPRPVRSWTCVIEDLTLWLSEADTDAIQVEVSANTIAPLDLRFDFVQTKRGRIEVWLTGIARDPVQIQAYLSTDAWTLSDSKQLPLIAAPRDSTPPALVVWRCPTPSMGANTLHHILGDTLGLPVEQVRLHRQQCTPGELERRIADHATVHRLRQRKVRKNPHLADCDRCGLPLSDPVSVQLGIGPECRKHYSQEVIRTIRNPSRTLPRPGSVRAERWLQTIQTWVRDVRALSSLTSPSPRTDGS